MYQHRFIMAVYLAGGVATAFAVGPAIKGQPPLVPLVASIGIGVIAVALIVWNILMYRKAAVQADPEFPVSAFERYTRPVLSSVSFLVGLAVMAF